MCQVIFILFITLFSSSSLMASQYSFGLNYQFQDVSEELDLASGLFRNEYSGQTSTMTFVGDGMKDNYDLSLSLKRSETDYGNVFVNDAGMNEVPLENISENTVEYDTTVNAKWRVGAGYSLILNQSVPLSRKYFKEYSTSLGVEKSFYNDTTILGINQNYSDQERPSNYYRDANALPTASATTIIRRQSQMYWDQIISEYVKLNSNLLYSQKTEERPRNYGISQKLGVAFNDQLFGKIGYSYLTEDKGDPLLNDQGYFENQVYSAEVIFEPIFDTLLSFSYDLIIETNEDPRTDAKSRVGVDQYGMAVDYTWDKYTSFLKLNAVQSNTNVEIFTVSGGLEWVI
ncbi:MAG: hypothetical protein H6620_05620 [Halobacteriovoraceae bacterium]|nr:hypothetical protein [Halobacteriovoraceae bacterium]